MEYSSTWRTIEHIIELPLLFISVVLDRIHRQSIQWSYINSNLSVHQSKPRSNISETVHRSPHCLLFSNNELSRRCEPALTSHHQELALHERDEFTGCIDSMNGEKHDQPTHPSSLQDHPASSHINALLLPEIISKVLCYLEPRSLSTAARVCRCWSYLATPSLYQCVQLTNKQGLKGAWLCHNLRRVLDPSLRHHNTSWAWTVMRFAVCAVKYYATTGQCFGMSVMMGQMWEDVLQAFGGILSRCGICNIKLLPLTKKPFQFCHVESKYIDQTGLELSICPQSNTSSAYKLCAFSPNQSRGSRIPLELPQLYPISLEKLKSVVPLDASSKIPLASLLKYFIASSHVPITRFWSFPHTGNLSQLITSINFTKIHVYSTDLIQILRRLHNITHLTVSDCPQATNKVICMAIEASGPNLVYIALRKLPLITYEPIYDISNTCSNLQYFDASGCTNVSVDCCIRVVRNCPHLCSISVSRVDCVPLISDPSRRDRTSTWVYHSTMFLNWVALCCAERLVHINISGCTLAEDQIQILYSSTSTYLQSMVLGYDLISQQNLDWVVHFLNRITAQQVKGYMVMNQCTLRTCLQNDQFITFQAPKIHDLIKTYTWNHLVPWDQETLCSLEKIRLAQIHFPTYPFPKIILPPVISTLSAGLPVVYAHIYIHTGLQKINVRDLPYDKLPEEKMEIDQP
ncbi:hypothetical protein BDV3_004192 [Batrachochytrium dendrobatidis]